MGPAPLSGGGLGTIYSHGLGTPKFLGTRAQLISVYTKNFEGAGPQILVTRATFYGYPAQNIGRVNWALMRSQKEE